MSTINKISETLNEKFVNAKIEGTGKLAPRPGYYFIKEINYVPIEPFGEVPIATINWKTNLNSLFVKEVEFQIALSSLYSTNSNETEQLQITDLIERVIYIHSPMLINKYIDGIEKAIFNCSWNYVEGDPKFLNVQNAVLDSFLGNAKTLTEAYGNFVKNAPYDVVSADEQPIETTSFDEDPNDASNDYSGNSDEDDDKDENPNNPEQE
jgi:hypothetical protein